MMNIFIARHCEGRMKSMYGFDKMPAFGKKNMNTRSFHQSMTA
jgi:hypothetical protein